MKKKGFTLIELLAVIVVLALIALIATPIILGVIESSRRKAFEDTGYGVVDAIRSFYVDKLSKDGVVGENTFTFPNSGLSLSGTVPAGGVAKLHADGTIEIAIHNNSYCVTKGVNEDAVTSKRYEEGNCTLSDSSSDLSSGQSKYFDYGIPTTSSSTDYTTLGKNVFVGLNESGNLSVCINRDGLKCFKTNNYDIEKNHIQEVFSKSGDTCDTSDVSYSVNCSDSDFYCRVDSDGNVRCRRNTVIEDCNVFSNNDVECDIG